MPPRCVICDVEMFKLARSFALVTMRTHGLSRTRLHPCRKSLSLPRRHLRVSSLTHLSLLHVVRMMTDWVVPKMWGWLHAHMHSTRLIALMRLCLLHHVAWARTATVWLPRIHMRRRMRGHGRIRWRLSRHWAGHEVAVWRSIVHAWHHLWVKAWLSAREVLRHVDCANISSKCER